MSSFEQLFQAWDEAHRELAIALDNFPEDDLWKRPHPRLLSVGELAGHLAYAQAAWAFGDGSYDADTTTFPIQSPLIDRGFHYYSNQVDHPLVKPMTSGQIREELKRIHEATKEAIAKKDVDDPHPYWRTWGNMVQYEVFHVAYHTGQAYSVRHLLGHETEDN